MFFHFQTSEMSFPPYWVGSARTFKTAVVLQEGAIVGKFRIVDSD